MQKVDGLERVRLDYIDNLRLVMIVLVVGLHSVVSYSHIGNWVWSAPEKAGPLVTLLFLVFEVHLQAFFMGFMFLLAGYFVPAAYDRKGFGRFLSDRWLRLGVPSLAFMLLVHPLTGYFLLRWWDADLPTAYAGFLRSGSWLSASGPMWFAIALLIFSGAYALCRLAVPGEGGAAAPSRPGLAGLAVLALGIALGSYLVRIAWPIGSIILNMKLCYFTQYAVLFAVGVQAYRRAWFQTLPYRLGLNLFRGALVLSPLAMVAVLASLADPMGSLQIATGGGTWPSAVVALWESFYCVAMCAGLLVLFRDRLNGTGGLLRRFTASSFGIYMMHMPVLVSVTLALRAVDWPPLAKVAVAWPAGLLLTFPLVEFGLRRIPGVRRFF